MITDGESISYRPARYSRPARREWPAREGIRSPETAMADRLVALEATVSRLEGSLNRLEELAKILAGQHSAPPQAASPIPGPTAGDEQEHRVSPTVAPPPAAPRAIEGARVLRMEPVASPEPAPAPAKPADMKVTMYAGEGATAILGQVRVKGDR